MNCLEVRERLADHVVATLDPEEAKAVGRHLRWCAGCRKEASELQQAAAIFAFALAPVAPPEDLEERVVETVRSAAGAAPGSRRRVRSAAASVVAAMGAVAALGWGAVMTGQADRFRDSAEQSAATTLRQSAALERFRRVVQSLGFDAEESDIRLGQLAGQGPGGGVALVLVSPRIIDFAMVIVNGLPRDPEASPYRVTIEDPAGASLKVGKITEADMDAGGGEEVFHQFDRDLGPFTEIVVRDVAGNVVLRGTIEPGPAVP
ncbi:MAG: zf-HC2 domain-containing protein [Actinobacteria bacterium]|nr:zf-HC2 domain-containing protein [Actinomycetota bacterium]